MYRYTYEEQAVAKRLLARSKRQTSTGQESDNQRLASSGQESIVCGGTLPDLAINATYVIDALKHFEGDSVEIKANGPTTPVVMQPDACWIRLKLQKRPCVTPAALSLLEAIGLHLASQMETCG